MRSTAAAAVVSTGAQGVSSLLVLALVARSVEVADFATFGVAMFAYPLVAMVVEGGTGPVVLRELASGSVGLGTALGWGWRRVRPRAATLAVAAGLAVLLVPFAMMTGPLVAAGGRATERLCFDALRGARESPMAYHLLTLGHLLVMAAAISLFAVGGLDDATAWPVLALSAVPLLLVTAVMARRTSPPLGSSWQPAASTPDAIAGTRVVQSLTAGSETWVAALVLGPAATAVLAGASRVALVAVVPLQVLNLLAARWVSTEDAVRLSARVRPVVRMMTALSLALTVVAMVFGADRLLAMVFGSGFPSGGEVLVATLLAQAINVASGPSGVVLMQSGRERSLLRIQAGSLVLRLVLLAAGAWLGGLRGLVIGLLCSALAQSVWLAVDARRKAGRVVHV